MEIDQSGWHRVCSTAPPTPRPDRAEPCAGTIKQEHGAMTGLMRGLRGVVLLGAGVAITGCSQLGGLGNVLGGVLGPATGSGSGNEVYGTVRYVDTQRQMLQITTQNGQTGTVYF